MASSDHDHPLAAAEPAGGAEQLAAATSSAALERRGTLEHRGPSRAHAALGAAGEVVGRAADEARDAPRAVAEGSRVRRPARRPTPVGAPIVLRRIEGDRADASDPDQAQRLLFAAHEMDERRRYLEKDQHRVYPLAELRGRGSVTDAALRADLGRLTALGVRAVESHAIGFAASVDQLAGELDLTGFWALFNALPHPRRTIPVPRRLLRALAGGFSRAVTGTLIALIIRCLFWHKKQGGYRVDGRAKASDIADRFGVSRRAVIDARKKLVELGWLVELPTEAWERQKWGGATPSTRPGRRARTIPSRPAPPHRPGRRGKTPRARPARANLHP